MSLRRNDRDISLQVPDVVIYGLGLAMFSCEVVERGIGQAFLSLVVQVHCYPLASLSRDLDGLAR